MVVWPLLKRPHTYSIEPWTGFASRPGSRSNEGQDVKSEAVSDFVAAVAFVKPKERPNVVPSPEVARSLVANWLVGVGGRSIRSEAQSGSRESSSSSSRKVDLTEVAGSRELSQLGA